MICNPNFIYVLNFIKSETLFQIVKTFNFIQNKNLKPETVVHGNCSGYLLMISKAEKLLRYFEFIVY